MYTPLFLSSVDNTLVTFLFANSVCDNGISLDSGPSGDRRIDLLVGLKYL